MEKERKVSIEARATYLPSDGPTNTVVIPTFGRWGDKEHPGFLPRSIKSITGAIERDNANKDTMIIVGDLTNSGVTDDVRAGVLSANSQMPRLYVATPETRSKVAEMLSRRIGIDQKMIAAITTENDYGKQRAHLDVVVGGIGRASGQEMKVLTLDDDTVIPHQYVEVKEGALPFLNGLRHSPNAQVIFSHEGEFTEDIFKRHPNPGLKPFYEHLGKTVGQVREANPTLRVVDSLEDTMHRQLEVALDTGVAKFVVTYPEDGRSNIENAAAAIIIGATATKSGMPDYRTVEIAKQYLRNELPEQELSRQSFPFGHKELFAFLGCDTNVDSAAFARILNERTSHLPWWFVSDVTISKANPHVGKEAGNYRADNENLPVLLRRIHDVTGDQYLYLGGIDTQVIHQRAKTGYRPDLVTVATRGSLVGNIAALEAVRRIELDSSGLPYIPPIDDRYEAPEEHSQRVFEEFVGLSQSSKGLIFNLEVRRNNSSDSKERDEIDDKIKRCQYINASLERQLAGWDKRKWKQGLDVEIRDQLRFYRTILEIIPAVIEETGKLIREGKYPIVEMVPSNRPHTIYQRDQKTQNQK